MSLDPETRANELLMLGTVSEMNEEDRRKVHRLKADILHLTLHGPPDQFGLSQIALALAAIEIERVRNA